jgi:phenylpropionate dioxygenase-like ring-hydroxylating dioxygenase large terminal subunit
MSTTDAPYDTFVGFPMPRDPQALVDRSRRPIVRTPGAEPRFPFPVPNGWFIVSEASALLPGEVKAFHVFGTDVVLYRGEDGAPRMVDAYCAHLGAHLGVGGRVEGECIRCPFHGWLYDGDSGRCTEIPYGNMDRIPSQAKVRTYPCIERNRMIWAWHHLEEGEPFYEVPEVPEMNDPEWLPYELVEFDVATCCQEMAENNVDFAHFMYVHGTDAIPEDEFTADGPYKRTVGMDGNFVREGYGLGLGVLHVNGFATFISSTTPIDAENVHVRWIFTAPKANGPDGAKTAATAFSTGVSQDLPIWENKRYVERPVVTKSEKMLLEQRQWAKQFYSNYDG